MRRWIPSCAVWRTLLGCVLCAVTAACRFDSGGLPAGDLGSDRVSLWDTALLDLAADHGASDAPGPDGTLPADLAVSEGSGCASVLDPQTVMLLRLDQVTGFTFKDAAGVHDGTVSAKPQLVAGPVGCGQALHVPAASSGGVHVEVPDALDFQLPQGSLDAWVRFDAATKGSMQGIISRDATGTTENGHLTLFRACDGSIAVRLQDQGSDHLRCSAPVPDGVWMHLGVNFGGSSGLSLFVDGTSATGNQSIVYGTSCSLMGFCGSSTTAGISGNSNPWVIGASAMDSGDGSATPVGDHLGGAIDEVRISNVRRTF